MAQVSSLSTPLASDSAIVCSLQDRIVSSEQIKKGWEVPRMTIKRGGESPRHNDATPLELEGW